jgi:hypothetical protein
MRSAHAITTAPLRGAGSRRQPQLRDRIFARLRAPSLDRELTAGCASWRSPTHAARALQLTSERHRRGLARSLEHLIEHAEKPTVGFLSAAVPPCREHVREAMPQILAISSRLRSGEPLDARGVARLRALLSDGAGPCYTRSQPDALALALQTVSESLDVSA